MFKYSTELEIHNHIKEKFNKFFNFNLLYDEFEVPTGRIDFLGEDETNYYVIELKREIITTKAIVQVNNYSNNFKETELYKNNPKKIISVLSAPEIDNESKDFLNDKLKFIGLKNVEFFAREGNYKRSKCYSLSYKAIEKVLEVQKEHEFESESAALEYILLYQPNENNIKELVYNTVIKIMTENNITFNNNSNKPKQDIKVTIDEEVKKVLLDAQDDIFFNMPE